MIYEFNDCLSEYISSLYEKKLLLRKYFQIGKYLVELCKSYIFLLVETRNVLTTNYCLSDHFSNKNFFHSILCTLIYFKNQIRYLKLIAISSNAALKEKSGDYVFPISTQYDNVECMCVQYFYFPYLTHCITNIV